MYKLLFLSFFIIGSISNAQNTFDEKIHRAKIYYTTESDFQKLEELGIPLDHGKHKKGFFVESDFTTSQIAAAESQGARVEITIEEVNKHYLNQNDPSHRSYVSSNTLNATCQTNNSPSYDTPVNFNNGSMGGYLTYAEMLQELDDMKTLYPNLITTKANISTFTTAQGRALQYVKISDNPSTNEAASESQVLYTAIHHAREAMSLQQTIFYMWYLLENYSTNPEIQAIVDNTELFFVPCVNPDGYIYNETTNPNGGGNWRKNRRNNGGSFGVDNNRNYSYITPGGTEVWNTAGTSGPNGDTYAGPNVFSEPENQALRWLVEQNNFKVALNAHSFSNLLLYPFGYANNQPTVDDATFQAVSGFMVSDNGYANIIASDLYAAAGDSDDFMYGVLDKVGGGTRDKVFAMTPEIGSSFWPAASQIDGICKDMMFLNISAAQVAGNSATLTDDSSAFISATNTNINYSIKRIGFEDGNFTVSINPISSNIVSAGTPVNHNGMSVLDEQSGSIAINLNPGISSGDTVTFELIVNNGLFDKATTITKIFGATTTILDEVGSDTATNWDATDWGISTTEFVSPSSSITDSPNGNYQNNQNKTIELSNPLDLTTATNAILSFNAKWDIENNYDYVQVQVSTNNGLSWTPQCGKFTNTGVSDQAGANNEPLYDGVQNDWLLEEIDLSDYLGSSILIRFQLRTDGGLTRDGFYFDNLSVRVVDPSLSTPDVIAKNFNIYPNPVKDVLNINSSLTNYDYKIYSIQGQLINEVKANNNFISIDYSNFTSGMYLLDIIYDNNKKTYKIIKE